MDDDLGDVLRHLNRHSRQAQRQLANHPLTRAYLEAGMRLLAEEFFPKPADEDDRPQHRSFLRISRDQVIKEVAHGPDDLPHQGNPGSLRDRWPYFSDYLGDLILYALRIDRFGGHLELAEQAADAIGDDTLSLAAHEIAYRDLNLKIDDTATRFHFLVTAFADHDPVVAKALSAVYEELTESWRQVYEKIFQSRGLRLRPGLSLDEFTLIITAVAEGLALRAQGDRSTAVLDHKRRRSLLGTAALALMIAFVDPGDGQTLEDIADRVANSQAGPPPAPAT
ncbi:MAG TPA: hypothetical protein VFQ77_07420 [Pseudonocardiaceae bacterium]|nr:hypothetical protein [Pseudonocardiaceae bacterium]